MNIADIVDPALLDEMRRGRYINVTPHPDVDGYRIWNYTQHTQFDRCWNAATLACRGLVTDADGTVIARPFPKFFHLAELDTIPDGDFIAEEKMDGSLGICYPMPDGTLAVATRGSFTSHQAQWATRWLNDDPARTNALRPLVDRNMTPLFEVIYPENRIVVDYGTRADLTLLTVIDNTTGLDVDIDIDWPGPRPLRYLGLDLTTVAALEQDNAEGFVLRWPCGTRAKVKWDEYLRLHRLITGLSARTIWEMLADHRSLDRLLEAVPDEFYQWVRRTATDLNAAFTALERQALDALDSVPRDAPRRVQAEHIKAGPLPGVVFAMLDQKPYAHTLWRMIRPDASQTFTRVDD